MGGVFAAQRALEGDFVGAGMEMFGGVASLVPGIGTAVDAATQAALLARDTVGHKETDSLIANAFTVTPGKNAGASTKGRGHEQITAATPATPNEDNNPYKNKTDQERQEAAEDLTDKLSALQFMKADPALLDKMDVQADLNKDIAEVLKQLQQITAIGNRKNNEANQTMIRQQQYAQNQTAP